MYNNRKFNNVDSNDDYSFERRDERFSGRRKPRDKHSTRKARAANKAMCAMNAFRWNDNY